MFCGHIKSSEVSCFVKLRLQSRCEVWYDFPFASILEALIIEIQLLLWTPMAFNN